MAENFGLDHEKNENDQHNRSKKASAVATGVPLQAPSLSGTATSGSIIPVAQVATRAVALPAVAEVNVNAIKERDFGGVHTSSNSIAKSTPSSKSSLAVSAELYSDATVNKQNFDIPVKGMKKNDSGQTQNGQVSRSVLDTTSGATARISDQVANNRLRNARKSDFATDQRLISPDSGFEPINEPIRSPTKPSASRSKEDVETSRTVTNPTTPRGDNLPGTQAGDFTSDVAPEPSQKRNHQRSELTGNKITVASQPKLARSPGSHRSQTSRESVKTGLSNTVRQNLPSVDMGEGMDGYRTTSQLRTQAISLQNKDTRASNVFSQVKSKLLNKEYWMRDENARDCFYCGNPFSTFRRKHHCRR